MHATCGGMVYNRSLHQLTSEICPGATPRTNFSALAATRRTVAARDRIVAKPVRGVAASSVASHARTDQGTQIHGVSSLYYVLYSIIIIQCIIHRVLWGSIYCYTLILRWYNSTSIHVHVIQNVYDTSSLSSGRVLLRPAQVPTSSSSSHATEVDGALLSVCSQERAMAGGRMSRENSMFCGQRHTPTPATPGRTVRRIIGLLWDQGDVCIMYYTVLK